MLVVSYSYAYDKPSTNGKVAMTTFFSPKTTSFPQHDKGCAIFLICIENEKFSWCRRRRRCRSSGKDDGCPGCPGVRRKEKRAPENHFTIHLSVFVSVCECVCVCAILLIMLLTLSFVVVDLLLLLLLFDNHGGGGGDGTSVSGYLRLWMCVRLSISARVSVSVAVLTS